MSEPPPPPPQSTSARQELSDLIGVRTADIADTPIQHMRDKPRLVFSAHQALAVILLLIAALGVSLTLLIQQSMHLAVLSNTAVETAEHVVAPQSPEDSSETDAPTELESDADESASSETNTQNGKLPDDGLVNINTAGLTELQTLTGVGPVTAQRIIDHRKSIGRYASVDQLLDVKGIGAKTMEKIREQVTVG